MSNRANILLAAVLTLLLGYLFFTFFEQYEEEEDLGWTKAAKRNPFLAAQMYSESLGTEVSSADSYLKLGDLAHYDTLLLAGTGQILSDSRLTELVSWVEAGGHLIVGIQEAEGSENDRLLEYYELSAYETDYEPQFLSEEFFESLNDDSEVEAEGEEKTAEEKKRERSEKFIDGLNKFNEELKKQGVAAREEIEEKTPRQKMDIYESEVDLERLTPLTFGEDSGQVWVEFDASLAIDHPTFSDEPYDADNYEPIYWRGSDYGVHFLQIETGAGLLTVVSDTNIFRSDNIGKFDHAFLWQILASPSSMAILYGTDMPSLGFMLRVFMPEVLIAFSTFMVMWIWFSMRRFGPVREKIIRIRRSSAEHIAASAGYMWRGNWQTELLLPVREDIRQQAEKRVSGYDVAADSKRLKMLSELSGHTEDTVKAAMTSSDKLNEDNFQKTVRTLQRIRDSL